MRRKLCRTHELEPLAVPPKKALERGSCKSDQPRLLASRVRDGQAKNHEMLQININPFGPCALRAILLFGRLGDDPTRNCAPPLPLQPPHAKSGDSEQQGQQAGEQYERAPDVPEALSVMQHP